MENRNVATFIKVVEMNNFTRAAESLGYSQAAVTAQIKQLEHELGAPLFDRIGKRINLTRAGETFLPYAFRLLKAEDEAVASIRAGRSQRNADNRNILKSINRSTSAYRY